MAFSENYGALTMMQLNFIWFRVFVITSCAKPNLEDPISEPAPFLKLVFL